MSNVVDSLVEMGFSKEKAELAATRTGSNDIQAVMDWILSHDDELEGTSAAPPNVPEGSQGEPAETSPPEENNESETQVKSIKCEQCQKLFKNQQEVEFHAAKSGHDQFSESTEEKKALTEEEKKDQLAKIEAKLKQRRLEREEREKLEALEKERNRIKQGKEMLEAKRKYDEIEMQKLVQQRRREKEEERLAKERVKKQIEEDKLARQRKFSGQPVVEQVTPPQPVAAPVQKPVAAVTYSEVQLQIRLTNGTALTQSFGVKEPLSAVRLYVEMNRGDDIGPFSLMTNYPKRIFGPEDYTVPLEKLGLGPRAILIVSKT